MVGVVAWFGGVWVVLIYVLIAIWFMILFVLLGLCGGFELVVFGLFC